MMKTNTSSLAYLALVVSLLAIATSPPAFGQTTATTTPVGLMKVTIPAASSTTTPKQTTLSVPLYGTADFSGLVASVDGINQFTLAGATWTANQFASPTAPRLARIMASVTAAHVGRFFLISGNTTNGQLQVVLPPGVTTVASEVSVGDTCEVVPANTLGALFGTASTLFATGATSATADNLQLFNGTTWDTYFHNGSSWVKVGDATAASQNSEIVYPDEGIFVLRRKTTALTLTLSGTVPSTAEQSGLAEAVGPTLGTTFLANRFPVGTTLNGLALQNTLNWTAASTVTNADRVLIWNMHEWNTYYFNGSQWRQSGQTVDKGSTAIPINAAVQVIRRSTVRSVLTQPRPYTL